MKTTFAFTREIEAMIEQKEDDDARWERWEAFNDGWEAYDLDDDDEAGEGESF